MALKTDHKSKMPLELDNEIALVRLAQSGSTEAFGDLVRHYERRVYRLVRATTTNDEDAEELLEATFSKAYETIGRFKSGERFYTWLARIAMNAVVFKLHRRHTFTWDSFEEHTENGDAMPTPANIREWNHDPRRSYSKAELNAILARALEDLEMPLRIIFVLGDIEGFSLDEISNVLGLSLPAARTSWMRARLKLRDNLSAWFENLPVPASKRSKNNNGHHSLGPS